MTCIDPLHVAEILTRYCLHLQFDDQGIVNTDARTIAVPDSYVNMIPTDVRGLTFSRTPQQNINILTLGNPDGVGVFFPNGLIGAISKPTGFNETASGTDDFPTSPMVAFQVSSRAPFASPPPPPPPPPPHQNFSTAQSTLAAFLPCFKRSMSDAYGAYPMWLFC